LDRYVDSTRMGTRKLGSVCAAYGIHLSEDDAHTSVGDCLAAARVAYKLAAQYPMVGEMGLPELQDLQAREYRRQAEKIAARFQGMGVERDVPLEWPVRTQLTI